MAPDRPEFPLDTAASVWDAVASHLEAFARAWDTGPPPDPAGFLPASPPAVRHLALIELVKFDIEQRLRVGTERPLEDYLASFSEVAARPPCDLIYEDYQLRRAAGRTPEPADYFRRFPERADELKRLLGAAETCRTTSVAAARVPDVHPGERLDDFDLLALLGEGQFAKVFLARQRGMQRLVALKVSAARAAEAETLAQLDHPNIVRVYDQRFLADRGTLLVYMPYLPGGTLLDVLDLARDVPPAQRSGRTLLKAVDAALDRRGELPPAVSAARQAWAARSWSETVCALGAKLAAALDCAHRRGVLHRDVKPANVLLTAEGEPLLADFNVGCCSKLDGAAPAAFFGGSLAYMAVEHLEAFDPTHPRPADSLDGRADVFGLAVTLWELLTGARPFGPEALRETWPATLCGLVEGKRKGLSPEAVAACPNDVPGLRDVLVRCLDPDPDRRPQTAGEMARELELCLRPATRELVRPAPGGWRERVRRHPILTIYPPGLLPNALASMFNIFYNKDEIIRHWRNAEDVFEQIIAVVNGVFFPLGILLIGVALWPVLGGLKRVRTGAAVPPEQLARARHKCLRLGSTSALVCVGCWLVAGVIWPLTLRFTVGPPSHVGTYFHFTISLAVCGLVAAAYPYFIVTFLAVRALYPALLGSGGPTAGDRAALQRVERELGWFRAAATAVPLIAVAMLAGRNSTDAVQIAVAGLGLAGLLGTLLAFVLEARIRADLAALAEVPTAE